MALYPAGEYIRLDQLAAELGISVTPVRRRCSELRRRGLLDQLPRRGSWYCRSPTAHHRPVSAGPRWARAGGAGMVNIDDAALASFR